MITSSQSVISMAWVIGISNWKFRFRFNSVHVVVDNICIAFWWGSLLGSMRGLLLLVLELALLHELLLEDLVDLFASHAD